MRMLSHGGSLQRAAEHGRDTRGTRWGESYIWHLTLLRRMRDRAQMFVFRCPMTGHYFSHTILCLPKWKKIAFCNPFSWIFPSDLGKCQDLNDIVVSHAGRPWRSPGSSLTAPPCVPWSGSLPCLLKRSASNLRLTKDIGSLCFWRMVLSADCVHKSWWVVSWFPTSLKFLSFFSDFPNFLPVSISWLFQFVSF